MTKLNKSAVTNPERVSTGKMKVIQTSHPDFKKLMKEGKITTGEPSDVEKIDKKQPMASRPAQRSETEITHRGRRR